MAASCPVSTNIPVRRLPINGELNQFIESLADRIGQLETAGTTGMPDYAYPTVIVNATSSTAVNQTISVATADRWILVKAYGYFNDHSYETFLKPIEIKTAEGVSPVATINNQMSGVMVHDGGQYVPSVSLIFPLAAGYKATIQGQFNSMSITSYPVKSGS